MSLTLRSHLLPISIRPDVQFCAVGNRPAGGLAQQRLDVGPLVLSQVTAQQLTGCVQWCLQHFSKHGVQSCAHTTDESFSRANSATLPPSPDFDQQHTTSSLIPNKASWDEMRSQCRNDAGKFHGHYAKELVYWFSSEDRAWYVKNSDDESWQGWSCADCKSVSRNAWQPWDLDFDDSQAPYYQWFCGGYTNVAMNEVTSLNASFSPALYMY